ncbi:thioredoxin family protein [Bacillus cereus]|uniref:thioredoxin family protein n=1 Tax=Bacillus cereus TaxID=1396 RepID=UPI0018F3D131|nr:thioredoxin family protein [Bacillus cereus]MBJ8055866.1 thioredoxin family protein [Bacillus cereus]
MKKILVVLSLFVIIFIGSKVYKEISYVQVDGEKTVYQKKNLHPKTVEQLEDKEYRNIIVPKKLEKLLSQEEYMVLYFYSSTCSFCKKATPKLNAVAKEENVNVYFYNLLEFDQGWDQFKIEQTPTVVVLEKGQELSRLEGLKDEDDYKKILRLVSKKS